MVRKLIVVLVLVGCGVGGYFGYKKYSAKSLETYYVDVVNAGKAKAEVTVSLAAGSFTVEGGSARTFAIEKQDPTAKDMPREFTIKVDGKGTSVKSPIVYGGHVVVDVTGTSCLVAADYGLQYRPKEVKLPEGTKTIKILKTYEKHPKVFLPGVSEQPGGTAEFKVDVGVGDALPEKLKLPKGAVRPLVRLVVVPAPVLKSETALYELLGKS